MGLSLQQPEGMLLSDLTSSLNLCLENVCTHSSVIDVTFYRSTTLLNWQVLDVLNLSDHRYVTFTEGELVYPVRSFSHPEQLGWNATRLDHEAFHNYVNSTKLVTFGDPNNANPALAFANLLDNYLRGACEASLSRRTQGPPDKRPVYWGTEGIAELRRLANQARRLHKSTLKREGLAMAMRPKIENRKASAWKFGNVRKS